MFGSGAVELAAAIVRATRGVAEIGGWATQLRVSVGMAASCGDPRGALACADAAMYAAKWSSQVVAICAPGCDGLPRGKVDVPGGPPESRDATASLVASRSDGQPSRNAHHAGS